MFIISSLPFHALANLDSAKNPIKKEKQTATKLYTHKYYKNRNKTKQTSKPWNLTIEFIC